MSSGEATQVDFSAVVPTPRPTTPWRIVSVRAHDDCACALSSSTERRERESNSCGNALRGATRTCVFSTGASSDRRRDVGRTAPILRPMRCTTRFAPRATGSSADSAGLRTRRTDHETEPGRWPMRPDASQLRTSSSAVCQFVRSNDRRTYSPPREPCTPIEH